MKERFEGPEGRRLLVEALSRARAVEQHEPLAEALADVVEVRWHATDTLLMAQEAGDNDVAFILSGKVAILVNSRVVAERGRGDHVGEMAAIEPGAPRSATVRAAEPTVAAWVKEPDLTRVADRHPHLWRAFAAALAERLRERSRFHPHTRMEPVILFLSDGTPGATALGEDLRKTFPELVDWSDEERPSTYPLDELSRRASDADFALFTATTRQHLLDPGATFQLGMLIGALGRERVFVVCPVDAPLPHPFEGIVVLSPEDRRSVTKSIVVRVRELGSR